MNSLSRCTEPSSEEERSPDVPEFRSIPRPSHTFDLEDDPFLACEESESDYCAVRGAALLLQRLVLLLACCQTLTQPSWCSVQFMAEPTVSVSSSGWFP